MCAAGPRRVRRRGRRRPALVYRAGLVHDLGRVAVPTGIWERPGPLRAEEWELVRLHPYHSGRILSRSPVLRRWGSIVSRHHERMDGSGYPAGVRGGELDAAARLLAAADVWHALGEARPHRAGADAGRGVAGHLRAAAGPRRRPGRLVGRRRAAAVIAAAAGRPHRTRTPGAAPARGRTDQAADRGELFISQSTVHTHTVHIYAKCDVSTRAGLAMFAMRHGLAADGQ